MTPPCLPFAFRPTLVAIALWTAFPAAAQTPGPSASGQVAELADLSLEQLLDVKVTSASKYAQRASDAPASVSVLTAEDFKTYGWRTLADALRSVRSLYVVYDRAYSELGMRGFQPVGDFNSRILLLIDGYRANDNVYDAGQLGREFALDVDLIQRVEIVRGPSSSVYGGNAVFAVINVITKSAGDIGGVEMSGSLGNYGTHEGRASFGKTLSNGAGLVLSASTYHSNGPTLSFPGEPSTGGAPVSGTDWEDASKFYGKLEYEGLKVGVAHSDREKGITGGLYGLPVDSRNSATDRHTFIDAAYTHEIGRIEWTGRLAYSEYEYIGDYYYSPTVPSKDLATGKWWDAELKGVTTLGAHKVVFGVEYQYNARQDQSNYDVAPYALYLDDKQTSSRTGVYAQDDFALTERLIVSAGLRYDAYSYGDAQINPRLGLLYHLSERTVAKLLYGTAFRPPNAYESYYSYPGLAVQNTALQPETITTYEAILETSPVDNLRLAAVAYVYRMKDLITFATDTVSGLQQYQNLDEARARGIEFESEYVWKNGARLRASYATGHTIDDTGADLPNSPHQLAKLNASIPVSEKLRAGIETQYVSSRLIAGNSIPAYAITNFTLSTARPWHGLDLSASVYNVFDRQYVDPFDNGAQGGLMPQDERNYRIKATYRF